MITRNMPQYWQAPLIAWDIDEDSALVCCQIRQETHDVKSFFFKSVKERVFRFLPGQFITLELPIDGEIIHRSYTISSPPTQPDVISITVKRQPDGIVSNWLHDYLNIGMQLSVLGPTGEFSCAHHPAGKYLFLSGGSGITPFMSMARTFHALAENQDIVFVHSARTPSDIIFRHELDLISFNQSHFRTVFVCEKVSEETEPTMFTGYLNLELLQQATPDFLEREIFTCGPTPYMAAVRTMLNKAGFDMARYHEESFNFDELQADSSTSNSHQAVETNVNGSATFSVQLTKSDATITCAPDQFILEAARAAGLRLPSSCSKGLCGTCKSKLISGKVDMKHGGGIRQREIDQGLFLPCCSTPLSNLVVER